MAQVIDSVPSSYPQICCCYSNVSSKIQVIRITNISNWYFERVVFPGQRLMFEAPSNAMLEVHCGMMASSILSDTISCERLKLDSADVVPFSSPFHRPADSMDNAVAEQREESLDVSDLLSVPQSMAS